MRKVVKPLLGLFLVVTLAGGVATAGEENKKDAGNLGCTITCALVNGSETVVANVGDSRTYLYRQGDLQQITEDHSYVWQLVQEGFLKVEEIYDHPQPSTG